MTGPISFRCRTCDQVHTGLPAWHFDAPAQVGGVPAAERSTAIDLGTDHCVITDRDAPDGRWYFVKGLLTVPVHGAEEPFTWGVWLSLSRPSFERYAALYEEPGRMEGESFFGWLCNDVPGYPETQMLKTRLHIRPYPNRPWVELEPTDHPLAVDQREGLILERAVRMAEQLLHVPPSADSEPDAAAG